MRIEVDDDWTVGTLPRAILCDTSGRVNGRRERRHAATGDDGGHATIDHDGEDVWRAMEGRRRSAVSSGAVAAGVRSWWRCLIGDV